VYFNVNFSVFFLNKKVHFFSASASVQCKLPDDGRRPKHVGAIFKCILM